MKWGPKAGQHTGDGDFLAKIAEQTGVVPTAIKERPTLDPTERPLWEAFHVLHASRASTGFGPGAIALSEIQAYAELMEIPAGEDRQELMRVIRTIDRTYLDLVSKKP